MSLTKYTYNNDLCFRAVGTDFAGNCIHTAFARYSCYFSISVIPRGRLQIVLNKKNRKNCVLENASFWGNGFQSASF